ncbi:Uncharacterised protein [Bergeyella zoohelcum]|uniref:Transposase DDE domain-containing protein n=1 Tax=Bergeyella zoohelcum TaxID=1015 RepID=A0A7Z8YMN3_9FLAO|nr:Uncharacterised protein [Bergeyella zoohelcum]
MKCKAFVNTYELKITSEQTINDELKNLCQIEHSRHRSVNNFIMNILGALTAYCFFPKKPSLNIQKVNDGQLFFECA